MALLFFYSTLGSQAPISTLMRCMRSSVTFHRLFLAIHATVCRAAPQIAWLGARPPWLAGLSMAAPAFFLHALDITDFAKINRSADYRPRFPPPECAGALQNEPGCLPAYFRRWSLDGPHQPSALPPSLGGDGFSRQLSGAAPGSSGIGQVPRSTPRRR